MRVYLLVCGIFCMLLALEGCYAQRTKVTLKPNNNNYVLTLRRKQDDGKLVCGTVQKDVRGNLENRLRNWGNQAVAKFDQTFFSRNATSKSNLVKNSQARIDLQDMFTRYGKRWANLQIQWNGVHPSPTTFAHLFLEADKTFPIRAIRNAFVESMTKCAKVWLEFPPNAIIPKDRL